MAHFAEIKTSDNIVLRVIVISDKMVNKFGGELSVGAEEAVARNISNDPSFEGEYPETYWKQTSKKRAFRKNYAGLGSTYDAVKDIFIPEKIHASWTLNANNEWQPPVAIPIAGNGIIDPEWDEGNQRWNGIQENTGVSYVWSTINNEWEEA